MMRKKLSYIIVVLFFLFTRLIFSKGENQFLDAGVFNNWIYSTHVSTAKLDKNIIVRPVGVEIYLLEVVYLSEEGIGKIKNCLYYRVPFKNRVGRILVTEKKELDECSEIPTDKVIFELGGVSDLQVEFFNNILKLNFKYLNKSLKWVVPFHNIVKATVHRPFKAMKNEQILPGLHFIRYNENAKKNFYLGKINDSFKEGTAIKCYATDKSCTTIGENLCYKCRYGHYEVIDFECPNGGSKYCGIDHCGEKNEPACIRGPKARDQELDGICQDDLKPVQNSQKILICQ